MKTITVVKDFHPKPYGRYESDGPGNGSKFRELVLAPALRENDRVHVDLTGYNRYGRSFLDEAFGGLIRESGFTYEQIREKLTYSHDLINSLNPIIDERIESARKS